MADRDEDKDDEVSSEPPESKARSKRDRDEEEQDDEEAQRAKKKALAKNTRKGATRDKPKQKPAEREKESAKAPESSSSNNLVWIGLLAVIALGAWWVFRGPSASTKEQPTTARSEMPTAPPAATPKPEQPAGGPEEPAPAPAPEPEAPSTAPTPSAPPPSTAGGGGGSFDRGVALEALAKNGAKAAGCRMRGEPAGTANVTVTFEPSGKVKSAEIRTGAFSGSPTGKCIIKRLMDTTIAPFTGEAGQVIAPVSVR